MEEGRGMMASWKAVSHRNPCPACGKPDWCAWSPDGQFLKCERSAAATSGYALVKPKDAGGLFKRAGAAGGNGLHRAARPKPATAAASEFDVRTPSRPTKIDLAAEAGRFCEAIKSRPELLAELAENLGVLPSALEAIGIGWASVDDLRRLKAGGDGWDRDYPGGAYSFPERDGSGRTIGVSFRATDGRKGSAAAAVGSHRGLTVPAGLHKTPKGSPILIVEGQSDCAALLTLGLAAVGRPSNSGGAELLAKLLEGRSVFIVGENDAKDGGAWPGRDGAKSVAVRIAGRWGKPVKWTLPPEDTKDVRSWLQARIVSGLNIRDDAARHKASGELLHELVDAAVEAKAEKATQAELLVRLALDRFRLGQTPKGEAFAVDNQGPNIATLIKGSKESLRSTLSRLYRDEYSGTPSATALNECLIALAGYATDSPPEPTSLRIAEYDGGIAIDLGSSDGKTVIVGPDGWRVEDRSPVMFRRTALTDALPIPQSGGSLDELRDILNVSPESWPVLLSWMVAAFIPEMPHAILLLNGEQGCGKSSAATFVLRLIDPSTSDLRCQPKDLEQWILSAGNSWACCVDNVSSISAWWSDALCRAATGEGLAKRKLYTDSDLEVLSFRSVIALTSIDAGSLRGDLADRLVMVDMERIADRQRRSEAEIRAKYAKTRPAMFGALLDLLAAVLAKLPNVQLAESPRMADFARVLAAVDAVTGRNSLELYLGQRDRLAKEVVEGDPVAEAICSLIAREGDWQGTATELLFKIRPEHADRYWPNTPRLLAGRLRRMRPAMLRLGVDIGFSQAGHERNRMVSIRQYTIDADDVRTMTGEIHRPHENPSGATVNADFTPCADDADDETPLFLCQSLKGEKVEEKRERQNSLRKSSSASSASSASPVPPTWPAARVDAVARAEAWRAEHPDGVPPGGRRVGPADEENEKVT